ncbi:MAG: helix-turn-helix domain-containing protein [Bacteroidota bacterium]
MKTQMLQPGPALLPYVSSIVVLESEAGETAADLPFYADGCPGLMFAQSREGVVLHPQNQVLDEFILYGQTVHPISLHIKGDYRLLVFTLYPYVTKPFFDVNPEDITDSCLDLSLKWGEVLAMLKNAKTAAGQVNILGAFLQALSGANGGSINAAVRKAIHTIIDSNGNSSMKQIRDAVHMTERTFERQFFSTIGISPKLFAQIVKFQSSLHQLTNEDRQQLSDIVYKNGFADQSHFIRTFKKFAGKTPGDFRRQAAR